MQTRENLMANNESNIEKSDVNQKVALGIGVIDSLNLTTVYTMFLTEVMRKMMEETGRFILFPLSVAASVINAGLAWRQAQLESGKNGTLAKAVIATLSAAAIGVAVIGGFVASAIFATVSPIIFVATLGAKTLYHLGATGYYWGKSVATMDLDKKAQYRAMAHGNAIGTVALTLATVAVGLVMMASKPIFAIFGITAGLISTSNVLYHLFKATKSKPEVHAGAPLLTNAATHEITNSATLQKTFNPRSIAPVGEQTKKSTSQDKAFFDRKKQPQVQNNIASIAPENRLTIINFGR